MPPTGSATTFYSNRGDDGTVNLSHLNTSLMLPTGLFCCEVPDVNNVNESHCVNIGEFISDSCFINNFALQF